MMTSDNEMVRLVIRSGCSKSLTQKESLVFAWWKVDDLTVRMQSRAL